MTFAEFDAIWEKEQYLVKHDWQRAVENGPGMWEKSHRFGYIVAPLDIAYDFQLELQEEEAKAAKA